MKAGTVACRASRRSRTFFCCAVVAAMAVQPTTAGAQLLQTRPPPKGLSFDDGHGILQAMRAGDAEHLDAIRKEPLPPSMQDFANAAYFRSLFRLKTSSEYARKCYAYGMQSSVLDGNPVIATVCGQLLAGNFNMEGDVADWARTIVETRQAVLPVIQRLTGRSDLVPDGFTGVPAEPFIGTVADGHVSASNDVVVPRVDPKGLRDGDVTTLDTRRSSFANAYLVTVRINGMDRTLVLDTGSSITMLRPSTAHVLGIETNPSPYQHLVGGRTIPMRPTVATTGQGDVLLGVARQMRIGTDSSAIVLSGVPVAVGGDVDVLGMNVLSWMDSLYITANHVTLDAKRLPIACNEPLEVASDLLGAYIPVLRYTVDGITQPVAFDSGSMSYLTGTSSAPTTQRMGPDVAQKRGDIAGVYEGSYVPVRATLGAGPSAHAEDIQVFPDYKAKFRYALGVKALKDFNVFFDFKQGKACLESGGG